MKSSPISKKQSSFSETSQAQRSLFASRPFDPEPEETEDAARETHATVQQQPARSPAKPFNFLTVPLHPVTAAPANPTGAIQAKLTIGQPNDKYEQEADRVASRVVNQINTPPPAPIQREENLEDEAAVQMPSVQREVMPEEEEELQRMPLQRVAGGEGMAASPDLETSIAQAKGGGQPLAPSIRAPIEQAMGADFSGVKVHTDAQSDRLNRSIQARAFTTGQDVFFRQGEYNHGSRGGQELIAHELTHVVQQTGGAVRRARQERTQSNIRVEENQSIPLNKVMCSWDDLEMMEIAQNLDWGERIKYIQENHNNLADILEFYQKNPNLYKDLPIAVMSVENPGHLRAIMQLLSEANETLREGSYQAKNTSGEPQLVPINEIEAPTFRLGKIYDDLKIAGVLNGINQGIPLPPVELNQPQQGSHRYTVRDGIHRYYASVKLGFKQIPAYIT